MRFAISDYCHHCENCRSRNVEDFVTDSKWLKDTKGREEQVSCVKHTCRECKWQWNEAYRFYDKPPFDPPNDVAIPLRWNCGVIV